MLRIDRWIIDANLGEGSGFNKLEFAQKCLGYINDSDEDKERLENELRNDGYVEADKYQGSNDLTAIALEAVLRDYSFDHIRVWFNSKRGRFITLTPIATLDDEGWGELGIDL